MVAYGIIVNIFRLLEIFWKLVQSKKFKCKLFKIKFSTKKSGAYMSISPQSGAGGSKDYHVWSITIYWNGKVHPLQDWTLPKLPIVTKNGLNGDLWKPLAPLLVVIEICVHWLFCKKFNSEPLLFEAFLVIIGNLCSTLWIFTDMFWFTLLHPLSLST